MEGAIGEGNFGIKVDARAQYLRLTPDILTRPAEITDAAAAVARACRALG